jgi:hypothetical protein
MRAIALLGVLFLAACSSSAGSSPAATPVGTPAPSGANLLTFSGSGDRTSPSFGASGGRVTLTYHYGQCTTGVTSAEGIADNMMRINEAIEFVVSLTASQPATSAPPEPVVDDAVGLSGSRTLAVPLPSQAGPFQVNVASTCQWSITVTGQP